MQSLTAFLLLWCTSVSALRLGNGTSDVVVQNKTKQAPGFQAYYATHTGRGMWKWGQALDMYQTHLGPLAARAGNMLEIGVQSGGSVLMYHSVLPQFHYYGMDVNRNCVDFQDATTTIYIGDQASVPAWATFFSTIQPQLDICIDDGGHQAHQMLTTIQQVLPHMNAGGFFLTEDIHGQNDDYLSKFFHPAADQIAWQASTSRVMSVHLYPFVLGVQITGGTDITLPPAAVTVQTLEELVAAIPQHLGAVVELNNPNWPCHTADALKNIFSSFYEMHGGHVREEPAECHNTMLSECAMIVENTNQQNLIKGVHVFPNRIVVETQPAPPVIAAHRKGTEWIPYNGPSSTAL